MRLKTKVLAICLILAMAGGALGAPGGAWSLRSDGWYAPSKLAVEVKDYAIDWSKELASDKSRGWQAGDDTIAACVWTYASGITGGPASISADKRSVITWLSDGTPGQTYPISLVFTTTQGRTESFNFKIEVKAK